jgi:rare lipoprotein A
MVPATLLLSGCGHRNTTVAQLPAPEAAPAPIASLSAPRANPPATQNLPPARIPITPAPPGGISAEDIEFVRTHRPILSEEGLATWYTAPYKGRKSANGQVFDDRALTAAHRTLPMGSLVVVTNLKTGQSSAMRITDRGPFAEDRIIDLTIASAKATGVYRAGLVQVRIDVYRAPKPIETGGRWCVQIGAFQSQLEALKVKNHLLHRYSGAQVIDFKGPTGYWVRIRVALDDKQKTREVYESTQTAEGAVFMVRLD